MEFTRETQSFVPTQGLAVTTAAHRFPLVSAECVYTQITHCRVEGPSHVKLIYCVLCIGLCFSRLF